MRIIEEKKLTVAERSNLLRRGSLLDPATFEAVREICANVRRNGDSAVNTYESKFGIPGGRVLRISKEEFAKARQDAPPELVTALRQAAQNIETFHTSQTTEEQSVETESGVRCWREARPIERVGLYVPAGTAPLPSTVLMLGIPAKLAGCSRIALCSPRGAAESVDPLVLLAAELVGIDEVYCVGGAQAIAAMAYGTKTVPKVDKIFGPGNRFVTAAKALVASDPEGAAIDMLAGPSEVLVIADETANPVHVAADLLSQSEHDQDARAILVSTSSVLAEAVVKEMGRLVKELPRRSIIARSMEASYVLLTSSRETAVRFSNDYAPEHLILNVRDAESLVPQVQNAGSVFIGPFSPVTCGDYASGTNHTLPTGGTARWASSVSLQSFQKTLTFQSLSKEGLRRLAPTLRTLARAEGLYAHQVAVDVRLEP